jgi:hypothetical protein
MEPEVFSWVAFMVTGKGGSVAWLLVIAPGGTNSGIRAMSFVDFMWGSNVSHQKDRYSMVLP